MCSYLPPVPDSYNGHWDNGSSILNCTDRMYNSSTNRASKKTLDQYIADANLPGGKMNTLHIGLPDYEHPDSSSGYLLPEFANCISWTNDATPAPNVYLPQDLFRSVFGDGSSSAISGPNYADYLRARKKSVLDAVLNPLRDLRKIASVSDRAILDQYFTEVREIEVAMAASTPGTCSAGAAIRIPRIPKRRSNRRPDSFRSRATRLRSN